MPVIGFLHPASPEHLCEPSARISSGPEGSGLCRRPERDDRVPLGRGPERSVAGAGGRFGPAPGRRDRGQPGAPASARGQDGYRDHPHRFVAGETRSGSDSSPASPGRAATSPGSTSSMPNWRRSAWSCCASWCRPPTRIARAGQSEQSRSYRDHVARRAGGGSRHGPAGPCSQCQTDREIDAAFATLGANGPMRSSSAPTRFSTVGASNWPR